METPYLIDLIDPWIVPPAIKSSLFIRSLDNGNPIFLTSDLSRFRFNNLFKYFFS